MSKILISGGIERENGQELGEGKYYKGARLLRLDTETGKVEVILRKDEGGENYPDEHPNLQFTAGCVVEDGIWLPTDTEVGFYSYPDLELKRSFSYPFFHNIHHINVIDGEIFVVSTGLDMVIRFDLESLQPLQFMNAEGKDAWFRFSPKVDYRKIHSTRPHDSHPNYVFKNGDCYWVTRCTQEDAVCLSDVSRRIDISRGRNISVHDGVLHDGLLYFTTVDGIVVVADPESGKIVEDINLLDFEPRRTVKGWCRGLMFDGDVAYIAYSRLRATRNKGKIAWINNFVSRDQGARYATVAAYDLKRRKKLDEWVFGEDLIHAIYTVLPEPSTSR